jgi:hypothetical protein
MPVKRKTKRRQMGGSAFTDFFTKTIPNGLKKAANFVKDQKLISKGLALIPDGRAQAAAKIAGQVGLGRRRRKHRPQMGGARGSAAMSI